MLDAAPALFTSDASGRGIGAILNEDGTPNSVGNPSEKGSIVVLYAAGAGPYNRSIETGSINSADLATLKLPVAVQVDGTDCEVLYGGTAPGLIAGVIQVNAKLPQQIRS